jgi:hypothetical protein
MTSLKDIGSRPRKSAAWEPGSPEIVRFITDEGVCYGFLWHALILGAYIPEHENLFLQYGTGTTIITGPKAEEFWDEFAQRKASSINLKPTAWTFSRSQCRCGGERRTTTSKGCLFRALDFRETFES